MSRRTTLTKPESSAFKAPWGWALCWSNWLLSWTEWMAEPLLTSSCVGWLQESRNIGLALCLSNVCHVTGKRTTFCIVSWCSGGKKIRWEEVWWRLCGFLKNQFAFAEPIHCVRMHLQNCRESFLWREDMHLDPRQAHLQAGGQWQGN